MNAEFYRKKKVYFPMTNAKMKVTKLTVKIELIICREIIRNYTAIISDVMFDEIFCSCDGTLSINSFTAKFVVWDYFLIQYNT